MSHYDTLTSTVTPTTLEGWIAAVSMTSDGHSIGITWDGNAPNPDATLRCSHAAAAKAAAILAKLLLEVEAGKRRLFIQQRVVVTVRGGIVTDVGLQVE